MLAEEINAALAPFRERRVELAAKTEYLKEVMVDGAERARSIARETMIEVKQHMGLL